MYWQFFPLNLFSQHKMSYRYLLYSREFFTICFWLFKNCRNYYSQLNLMAAFQLTSHRHFIFLNRIHHTSQNDLHLNFQKRTKASQIQHIKIYSALSICGAIQWRHVVFQRTTISLFSILSILNLVCASFFLIKCWFLQKISNFETSLLLMGFHCYPYFAKSRIFLKQTPYCKYCCYYPWTSSATLHLHPACGSLQCLTF